MTKGAKRLGAKRPGAKRLGGEVDWGQNVSEPSSFAFTTIWEISVHD